MTPVTDKDATQAWTCDEHGRFDVRCSCGYIDGQDHDIVCPKRDAD